MHIGIVGSGIAGLTAAWLFRRAGARVTLFERHSGLGMDAHGVSFELDGHPVQSDVPPRMFNSLLWPNLFRLYQEVGVVSEPIEPSKSFGQFSDGSPVFLKLGASYQPKLSSNLLVNKTARTVLKDIGKMLLAVPRDLALTGDKQLGEFSIGEYLERNQYSRQFIYQFLYPALSSTVCTCSYQALSEYPAVMLLDAMWQLTRPEGLRRTTFGSQDVVQRLSEGIEDMKLGCIVTSVDSVGDVARVTTANQIFQFDHVIVATQANAAGKLVAEKMPAATAILNRFQYEDVPVVVHQDKTLMPGRKQNWSHFNFLANPDDSSAMCSIWMNRFYPEWNVDLPVFQTIMPLIEPDPSSVICAVTMQRPVVNRDSLAASTELNRLLAQPNRRVWFCGSYASVGIPLLESGVVSSLAVANRIGVGWPDECSV